jgi:glucose uptake protein GlcU
MKNTITNIIGGLIFALGVYMFTFQSMEVIKFIVLSLISGVLVYFDNKGIKSLIKKGINKHV